MPQGTVSWFDTDKGFGFIGSPGTGDVFVHSSALAPGLRALAEGQQVQFDVVRGDRGLQAQNVRPTGSSAGRAGRAAEAPRGQGQQRRPDRRTDAGPAGQRSTGSGGRGSRPVGGSVSWFNAEKGFGFLAPDSGEPDVFVHASTLQNADALDEGQRVEFEIDQGDRGAKALNVRVVENDRPARSAPRRDDNSRAPAARERSAPASRGRAGGMRVQGTLSRYDGDRGFGFVTPDDVFLHVSALSGDGSSGVPEEGMRVEFELRQGDRGLLAADVRVLDAGRTSAGRERDAGPRAARRSAATTGDQLSGTVSMFHAEKGFGFISPNDGSDDVFVHFSAIVDDAEPRILVAGERVAFDVVDGARGSQASDVQRLD